MQLTTTKCRRFGHPEFVLMADEASVPDVYLRKIVDSLEEMVAGGSVFRPGQSFQIGWMWTTVAEHDADRLTLLEPDMQSFPIRNVPGISQTLRQMMKQLFTLDSVSLRREMQAASILQSLIVCSRYTEPDFFMHRTPATTERDSGWFVGCRDRTHDHNNPANLRSVSVYDAYLHQRGIEGFITFPPGSMIVFDQTKGLGILKDGKQIPISPGSFLDRLSKS